MKKGFVENFYENRSKNIEQLGFFGYLHNKLKKFEVHRSDAVLNLTKNGKFFSVLDIGCSEGPFLQKFKKLNPQAEIFGIDVSSKDIDFCRKKFDSSENNFSVQNIDNGLNFADNTFDLVIMIAVLEHVFDPIFAIKEIRRILKPTGVFIVEVPNIAFLPYRLKFIFGIRPRTSWGYGWDGGHLNYFTIKDLRNALKKEGLVPLVTTGSGIFLKLRKWWGSLLLPNIIIKTKKI